MYVLLNHSKYLLLNLLHLKVDSLMTEIEDLATKQGEEEARRLQKKEEIKALNVDDLTQNERNL
jgi:hypothetical protein